MAPPQSQVTSSSLLRRHGASITLVKFCFHFNWENPSIRVADDVTALSSFLGPEERAQDDPLLVLKLLERDEQHPQLEESDLFDLFLDFEALLFFGYPLDFALFPPIQTTDGLLSLLFLHFLSVNFGAHDEVVSQLGERYSLLRLVLAVES